MSPKKVTGRFGAGIVQELWERKEFARYSTISSQRWAPPRRATRSPPMGQPSLRVEDGMPVGADPAHAAESTVAACPPRRALMASQWRQFRGEGLTFIDH